MAFINAGNTVKLKSELLQYEANKRWIGVVGKVNRTSGSYAYVSWSAPWKMKNEVEVPVEYLERVYN